MHSSRISNSGPPQPRTDPTDQPSTEIPRLRSRAGGSRASAITPQLLREAQTLVQQGDTLKSIANSMGVPPPTLRGHIDKHGNLSASGLAVVNPELERTHITGSLLLEAIAHIEDGGKLAHFADEKNITLRTLYDHIDAHGNLKDLGKSIVGIVPAPFPQSDGKETGDDDNFTLGSKHFEYLDDD